MSPTFIVRILLLLVNYLYLNSNTILLLYQAKSNAQRQYIAFNKIYFETITLVIRSNLNVPYDALIGPWLNFDSIMGYLYGLGI